MQLVFQSTIIEELYRFHTESEVNYLIIIRTFTVCINKGYCNEGGLNYFLDFTCPHVWTKLPALEDLKGVICREV